MRGGPRVSMGLGGPRLSMGCFGWLVLVVVVAVVGLIGNACSGGHP